MPAMTVQFNFRGLQLEAELTTWPASRGARESMGQPIEPDEDAGFDVETVTLLAIEDDELTHDEIIEALADDDGIYQAIVDELAGWEPDYI